MNLINFKVSNNSPFFLMSGNCVVESEQSAIDTAGELKNITNKLNIPFIYKSSFDKLLNTTTSSILLSSSGFNCFRMFCGVWGCLGTFLDIFGRLDKLNDR